MASNYTKHLGLCQWEATDQVLRTDFNEDNTKVDAALKEQAEALAAEAAAREAGDESERQAREEISKKLGLHVLYSYTYEEAEKIQTINLTLPAIDWSQWKTIHVLILPGEGTGSYSSHLGNVRLMECVNYPFHAVFYPLYQQCPHVHGISFCGNSDFRMLIRDTVTWDSLTTVIISRYTQYDFLTTGTSFILLGEA